MAIDDLVEEWVVPDVHANWQIYHTLDSALAQGKAKKASKRRVFLLGDYKGDDENIDIEKVVSLSQREAQRWGLKQQSQEQLQKLAQVYGGEANLIQALQAGVLPPEHSQIIEQAQLIPKLLDERVPVDVDAYRQAAAPQYKPHNDFLEKIKANHGIDIFAIEGNHDDTFAPEFITAANFLRYTNALQDEGIVSTFGCHPQNGGEVNEYFNGPNLTFCPMLDDHPQDVEKSSFYANNKDKEVNLIVTHSGPQIGDIRGRIPGMKGLTRLVQEQGPVVYEGHLHGGVVYRDPESKAWIIRPGVNHVARVFRRGKEIEEVHLYEVGKTLEQGYISAI